MLRSVAVKAAVAVRDAVLIKWSGEQPLMAAWSCSVNHEAGVIERGKVFAERCGGNVPLRPGCGHDAWPTSFPPPSSRERAVDGLRAKNVSERELERARRACGL